MTLGLVAFESMMAGVWGVQISPLNYVAVLAAMALFFGSFVCLFNLPSGRKICGVALAALGTFYVPAIVSIIPANNESFSPFIYLIFLAYFGALGFALFYPTRRKFSFPFFFAVLAIAGAFAVITYAHRVAGGEFDRPSFSFFVWKPGGSALQIEDDDDHWINDEIKSLLEQNGIHGQLEQGNLRDDKTRKNRVVIIAQRQITLPKQIFYPRNGTTIIYAFDGTNWMLLPKNAPAYLTFATLKPDGSQTMLEQDVVGGTEGCTAFIWK